MSFTEGSFDVRFFCTTYNRILSPSCTPTSRPSDLIVAVGFSLKIGDMEVWRSTTPPSKWMGSGPLRGKRTTPPESTWRLEQQIETMVECEKARMLKENEELLNSQAEVFMIDLCSKDIVSLVFASQLEEMSLENNAVKNELMKFGSMLELLG